MILKLMIKLIRKKILKKEILKNDDDKNLTGFCLNLNTQNSSLFLIINKFVAF